MKQQGTWNNLCVSQKTFIQWKNVVSETLVLNTPNWKNRIMKWGHTQIWCQKKYHCRTWPCVAPQFLVSTCVINLRGCSDHQIQSHWVISISIFNRKNLDIWRCSNSKLLDIFLLKSIFKVFFLISDPDIAVCFPIMWAHACPGVNQIGPAWAIR